MEEPARVSPEARLWYRQIFALPPSADPSRQQLSDCFSPGSDPSSDSLCALQAPGNGSAAAAGSQPQLCSLAALPSCFIPVVLCDLPCVP